MVMKPQEKDAGGNATPPVDTSATVADFPSTLLSQSPYPRRKYSGWSPKLSAEEAAAIRSNVNIKIRHFRSRTGAISEHYVQGPVLFDNDGRIAGQAYDLEDPFVVAREMYKLTTDQRIQVSKELERVGWYGNRKVSEAMKQGLGWTPEDESVWARLLSLANVNQKTWSDMVGLLGSFASVSEGGPSVRVTSDEDAMAYAREAFFSKLGRAPNKKELAEAIDFIQNKERAAVASGQQMPSTGLTAGKFAEQTDPTAKTTWGLGNAIALALQALGQ